MSPLSSIPRCVFVYLLLWTFVVMTQRACTYQNGYLFFVWKKRNGSRRHQFNHSSNFKNNSAGRRVPNTTQADLRWEIHFLPRLCSLSLVFLLCFVFVFFYAFRCFLSRFSSVFVSSFFSSLFCIFLCLLFFPPIFVSFLSPFRPVVLFSVSLCIPCVFFCFSIFFLFFSLLISKAYENDAWVSSFLFPRFFSRSFGRVSALIVLFFFLTLLEPQSRSGDKPVKFQVVLSPNGTAVLKGLRKALHFVSGF